VPITTAGHTRTFNKSDHIGFWICILQRAKFAVQVIKGEIDNPGHGSMVSAPNNFLFLGPMVQFLVPLLKGEKYGYFSISSPRTTLSFDRAGQ
jgi:hypothetical protein